MYTLVSCNRKIPAITVLVFIVFFALTATQAVATTIYVPDDYLTIQGAVDAASPGDTIIVRVGTYVENVKIETNDLTIIGENGSSMTVVQAENPGDHVFEIHADDVHLSGFSITGATEWIEGEGAAKGINVRYSHGTVLDNNDVYGNKEGIVLYNCYDCTVYSNTIFDHEHSYGIWVSFGSGNLIDDNFLRNNSTGIYLHSTRGNTLSGNDLRENGYRAISIDDFAGAGSEANVITRNSIEAGRWAIRFRWSSNNTFYLNNFLTSALTEGFVVYESPGISNRWCSPSRLAYDYGGSSFEQYLGNYWSDYGGTDADGDGIGETPYSIDLNSDQYPLMDLFENYVIHDEAVYFPDPNLEQAIREATNKPTGDIYKSDLIGLASLDADQRGIVDLEGIQYCVDLTELDLSGNQIVDISALTGLTNLTYLNLGGNKIVDISPLSALTNLTRLSLNWNEGVDISPLSGLTNLAWLSLYGNQIIVDISALTGLTNLTYLNLGGNKIVDISPLSGLTNLTDLDLSGNEIVDISPLSGLTNLAWLSLYGNQIIVDISPLSGLTNLTYLNLGGNKIADISALTGLTNLTRLNLGGGPSPPPVPRSEFSEEQSRPGIYQINKVSPPSEFGPLHPLWLYGGNEIVDISPLTGLTNLEELSLNGNKIVDISPLSGLANLTALCLADNQIVDIVPLVNNAGIDSGDFVDVRENYLDLTPGSDDRQNIQTLINRGVDVEYEPQNPRDVELHAFLLCGEDRADFETNIKNMRSALTTWWGFAPENVTVCEAKNLEGEWVSDFVSAIREEIEAWMQQADPDDIAVFYYAGHGEEGGGGIALKCGPAGVDTYIGYNELNDWLVGDAETTVIILDACYSGSAMEDLADVPGRWVLTSTNSTEEATCWAHCDWSPLWNVGCIFTTYFVEAVSWQHPEIAGLDELISLREAFDYAYDKCSGYLFGHFIDQHPQIWPEEGDFVIETQNTKTEGAQTLRVAGFCPIDLIITDPDGNVFSEDVNEIGENAFRVEGDFDNNGELDVLYTINDAAVGVYSIEVLPNPEASPTDSFSLYAVINELETTLADEVQIQNISDEPYEAVLGCHELSYGLAPTGWHMLSIPGDLCGPCLDDYGYGNLCCTLCDDLSPCYIFRYDPGIGGYQMAPPAENIDYKAGMGFWMRTYADDVMIDAEVQVPTEAVEVSLGNGWNQIGNPFPFAVSANALKVRCGGTELSLLDAQAQGWVSAYLFGYDTVSGGYVMIDPTTDCLQPWSGYWMRSYQDGCVLIIPPKECSTPSSAGEPLSTKELQARGLELPPSPPALKLMSEDVVKGLTVRNIPNPIRSEHTTTFKVEGKEADLVQAIRVDIYNLAGQKVFTQDINAKELEWHTVNDAGELLANGVYLYQVWVKLGGKWYPTGIHKLAVVR